VEGLKQAPSAQFYLYVLIVSTQMYQSTVFFGLLFFGFRDSHVEDSMNRSQSQRWSVTLSGQPKPFAKTRRKGRTFCRKTKRHQKSDGVTDREQKISTITKKKKKKKKER